MPFQNLLRRMTSDEIYALIDTALPQMSASDRAELLHRTRSIPDSIADEHERYLLRSLLIWDQLDRLLGDN